MVPPPAAAPAAAAPVAAPAAPVATAPATYIQANTNGRLHHAGEPVISPLDRGFLYGDSVYEVWRTYHGTLFAFEEHWTRLEASASALGLELPFDSATAWREVARTAAAWRHVTGSQGELYVRLQVSRGSGPIGLDPALAERPLWTILVRRLPEPDPLKAAAGINVAISNLRRNHPATLNPAWKTGNYLNNLLALREAKSAGADEVLMLNLDGSIAEGSTTTIAFVQDGRVLTPSLDTGILAGITRHILLRHVAPRAGLSVHESSLRPAALHTMTEAFFLSTTRDITPIASIDSIAFRTGPGTVTAKLKELFATYARDYSIAHPDRNLH